MTEEEKQAERDALNDNGFEIGWDEVRRACELNVEQMLENHKDWTDEEIKIRAGEFIGISRFDDLPTTLLRLHAMDHRTIRALFAAAGTHMLEIACYRHEQAQGRKP